MESKPTRVLLAVSESKIRGYPYALIRSRGAFEWTIRKIVRSNTSGFRLHFLHVQDPQPKKNKKHRSSSLGSSSQNSESSDTQDVDLELRISL
ncbi:hypothetical protein LWI29_012766 [Acer saccharum]|uniref:Uncharacterized protein n=1 Tax=Acer saccharum TaxID=4024 RepID=A0AA39VID2_ACESA|nr:hypothetical protein LWI29_012766 [Acer saccharum]